MLFEKPPKRVVHVLRDSYTVYIGREMAAYDLPQSVWANPFKVGPDGTREEVIAKYREWILTQPDLLARLPELKGQVLGCWCAPNDCHGRVLVEMSEAL